MKKIKIICDGLRSPKADFETLVWLALRTTEGFDENAWLTSMMNKEIEVGEKFEINGNKILTLEGIHIYYHGGIEGYEEIISEYRYKFDKILRKMDIVEKFYDEVAEKHKDYVSQKSDILGNRQIFSVYTNEYGEIIQELTLRHTFVGQGDEKKRFKFRTYVEGLDLFLEVDVIAWEKIDGELVRTSAGAIVDINLDKGISMAEILFELRQDLKNQQK